MTRYYLCDTGTELKSLWHYHKLVKSARHQVETAPGNIQVDTKYVNGIFHTRTVWEDRAFLDKFMNSKARAQALIIAGEAGRNTTVCSYECDSIPEWRDAIDIWDKLGGIRGQASSTGALMSPSTEESYASLAKTTNLVPIDDFCSVMVMDAPPPPPKPKTVRSWAAWGGDWVGGLGGGGFGGGDGGGGGCGGGDGGGGC